MEANFWVISSVCLGCAGGSFLHVSALFTCLMGIFMATSQHGAAVPCLSKDPQIHRVPSRLGRHLRFQLPAYCVSTGTSIQSYWWITLFCASCKWKQQMTLLLGQTSSRLSRMPGIMPKVDLNKKIKKDLVPAAMMIYGSFKSVSNGVPFWL